MQNDAALIICYGVSGCGKSSVAHHIAEQLTFEYIEADDFHSELNKTHMAAGHPLTDDMREPWIQALCLHIKKTLSEGKSCVMANSCLKKNYRQRYRELGVSTLFLHLEGSYALVHGRMQQRKNHFMPASLLQSQFDTLEAASDEADVISLDISHSFDDLKSLALNTTKHYLGV